MISGFKDLRDHLFSNGHVQQLKKQFNIGSESPLSFDHFQSSKQSISTSPNPTQIQSSPVQTNPVAAAATQLDPAVYAQQIARATAAARFSEQLSNSATSPSGGSSGFNLFGQLQANIQRIIARQTLNQLGSLPPMGIESIANLAAGHQNEANKQSTNSEAVVTEIPWNFNYTNHIYTNPPLTHTHCYLSSKNIATYIMLVQTNQPLPQKN